MKHGDFTKLAKYYINRPAYSQIMLDALLKIVDYTKQDKNFHIVEPGAGTGKFTKMLLDMQLEVTAIEPNDAMREEGIKYTARYSNVRWKKGSGEKTGLSNACADWVVMASAFHWTDYKKSLPEFARILKKDRFFTALWNSRHLTISELHSRIECKIKEILPELKRISSGSQNVKQWEYILVSTGHFKDCIFMETDYVEQMSQKRYLDVWRSVNDIRVQAGEYRWNKIMEMIQKETSDMEIIEVPYKIRAWTVKKVRG